MRTDGGVRPRRQGQRSMAAGFARNAVMPQCVFCTIVSACFDKDPAEPCKNIFKAEHVAKQNQEENRGVRGHRSQKSTPEWLVVFACELCGDTELPCAREICL